MKNIYDETDKKINKTFNEKRGLELGRSAEWPVMTNLELQEAIETRENGVLYIEKSLFKRLGDTDLKKLGRKNLSFVMVERERSFRDRLRVGIDVGRVNRISGREEYVERVAVNVYSAILEIEPRTAEEKAIQEKLLRRVNKYIHEVGEAGETKEKKESDLKEIER